MRLSGHQRFLCIAQVCHCKVGMTVGMFHFGQYGQCDWIVRHTAQYSCRSFRDDSPRIVLYRCRILVRMGSLFMGCAEQVLDIRMGIGQRGTGTHGESHLLGCCTCEIFRH